MDTFLEQLVEMKRGGKYYALLVLLWAAAIAVSVLLFLVLPPLALVGAALAFYGAYFLSKMLFVEYEYIITNDCADIDKITGKSSRKRELSFELSGVESIEKFNPQKKYGAGFSKKVVAADFNDPNALVFIIRKGNEKNLLVFAPDDRIKTAMKKFISRTVSGSLL